MATFLAFCNYATGQVLRACLHHGFDEKESCCDFSSTFRFPVAP